MDFDGRYNRCGKVIHVIETDGIFNSRKECAKALGVVPSAITQCISGRSKTCGGYHLEIIDQDYGQELDKNNWREHPERRGIYVSKNGEIISYKSGKANVLPKRITPNGYSSVVVGHNTTAFVHRLVAETYIPNPENKPTVNHKDHDRLNNYVDNLEWMTHSENIKHSYNSEGSSHSNIRKVLVVETNRMYNSIRECANDLQCDSRRISDCLNGKIQEYHGYHFEAI